MPVFFLAFPDAVPDTSSLFSGLGGVGGPAQALPGGLWAPAGAAQAVLGQNEGREFALFALFLPCCLSQFQT